MSTFGRPKAEHEPDETPDDPPGRRVTHLTRWGATVRVFYDLDVRTHRGFVRWGAEPRVSGDHRLPGEGKSHRDHRATNRPRGDHRDCGPVMSYSVHASRSLTRDRAITANALPGAPAVQQFTGPAFVPPALAVSLAGFGADLALSQE